MKQTLLVLFLAGLFGALGVSPLTTMAQDNPCYNDFRTYCRGVDYGKMNMIRCLEQHWDSLSNECRQIQENFRKVNEEFLRACEEDRKEYCQRVEPARGSDLLADCLTAYREKLTDFCAEALANHERAAVE